MDELNQTEAVESVPAENQGDLADLVDIGSEPVEAASEQPTMDSEPSQDAAPADAPEPRREEPVSHASFSALDDALSDIEELEHDGFYDKIDEGHLKELPPVARRILHNFRVDRKKQAEKHHQDMQAIMSRVEDRERRLSDSEREFSKRQSEFASLVEDPEVQKILASPDGELPDIFTEEGVEARIQRGIAKGMSAILEPMKNAADVKARENQYLEFLDKHPQMRDEKFKKEVAVLVRSRGDKGIPLSTQDAYQIVTARRISAKQQIRVQQEQRARQQSARRIGRNTHGGNPSSHEVPADIQKQGAFAIATWLKANPEAAVKISRSIR